ncbi:MAG: GNAT family N-acetyltransferase [Coriobacteriaceae bacterium]|nr:GNAT family N-acetyltransferase [Coriobacteriaceae bacterium]
MTVRMGESFDFDRLTEFYDEVVKANSGTPFDVHWNRKIHPSDSEIAEALRDGSMYMGLLDDEVVAASIVNDVFATGYDTVLWVFGAEPGKILCIHLFATKPALQGQGLGRKFLQAIIDDTRKRGFQVLRLDAFQHNTPACALYEKMGFQYRGVADLVYEDEDLPEDLPIVVYEMQL